MKHRKVKKREPDASIEYGKLRDFKIGVNSLGEIRSNTGIDAINEFLDENLEDRKLKGRVKMRDG